MKSNEEWKMKVSDIQSELKQSVTIINSGRPCNSDVICGILLNGPDHTKISPVIQSLRALEVWENVNAIAHELVIYLPSITFSDAIGFRAVLNTFLLTATSPFLAPLLPLIELPTETAKVAGEAIAWMASANLVKSALPQLGEPLNWTLLNMAQVLEQEGVFFRWQTASALQNSSHLANSSDVQLHQLREPVLVREPVLAVVPHYRCEAWLTQCLRSLLAQTHPPDGIVVIDDGSEQPPIEIVEQFPTVTLLAAPDRVGPYRLIQQVIDDTHYWGYLFQDADDWSSSDRLQHLLHKALTTGAELVGTQELRVYDDGTLVPVSYPLDVNAALATHPGHPLLHPTSLVTRDLVQRIGGFATGLRFGGDTEFLLRAVWSATVVNIPNYSYFRRKRPDSLTTHPETGLESPARRALLSQLKQRAIARQQAVAVGESVDLSAIATGPAIALKHIIGPRLV